MGFKTNMSEASQGYSIKPEGDYECIITAIEERQTKNGKYGLNFSFVIRNDVAGQRFGNAFLFHTIWKKKEPNEFDMQVNGYNFGQLMAMGKAAALPDGKDYENLTAYCSDLVRKCVRVTLKHEEYNGEMQERISYVNPTKFPECRHVFKKSTGAAVQTQNSAAQQIGNLSDFENDVIGDDGVPF